MQADKLSFKLFKEYAVFLKEKHLDELVKADIKRSYELDLPLLKYFEQLSEQQLFDLSKKGLVEYLDQIINDQAISAIIKSMQDWKDDKLDGIGKNDLVASDISLIYNVRKHSLIKFLPLYTSDLTKALSIIQEVEDFYTFQESLAINTFSEISKEEVSKKEALLTEAQAIAHLGSWEWNTVSNLVSWSDEMCRLFGYEPGEIQMDFQKYMAHIHPEDKDLVSNAVYKCYSEGISYTFENRIVRKDGEIRWLEAKGQVTEKQGNKHLKLAGTAMDITEQKKAQDAIKIKTEALLASNKELEAFCYTISHDLRSPLRAIDGFGRKLANEYTDSLDQEGRRLLNVVRSNAQQMGVLIDSLLEFSRLNRKEIKKSILDMSSLLHKVIEQSKDENPNLRAEFIIKELSDIPGDTELMHMVWQNLISNAIKFSSKVASPKIEIGSMKKPGKLIYYIKDNGAGFEMEYVDKLFGVFQRLHTTDEFSGTGVGLATVQRIVHRHGGQVWAEGQPGIGACFYFSFPISQEVLKPIYS